MGKHIDWKIKYNYLMRYWNGESPTTLGKELIQSGLSKSRNPKYIIRGYNKQFKEGGIEGLKSMSGKTKKPKKKKREMPKAEELTRNELEWFYKRYKDKLDEDAPESKKEIFEIIKNELEDNEDKLSKSSLCRIFGVSRQGYNKWLRNGAKVIGNYNNELLDQINNLFYEKRRAYGYVRITQELNRRGIKTSEKTVLRYMQHLNIKSKIRSKSKYKESKNTNYISKDLINRDWKSNKMHEKIYTDVTQIRVSEGWAYLSVTLDGHNNEIIDHKISLTKGNNIAIPNIKETLSKIKDTSKTIIHSDHGSEYSSFLFKELQDEYRFKQSMGRVGVSLDNRQVEYFFSILKQEYLLEFKYERFESIKNIVNESILDYNQNRIQSCLGWKTPQEYLVVQTS